MTDGWFPLLKSNISGELVKLTFWFLHVWKLKIVPAKKIGSIPFRAPIVNRYYLFQTRHQVLLTVALRWRYWMNYVSFVVGRLISPFDDRYIFSAVRTVINIVVVLTWEWLQYKDRKSYYGQLATSCTQIVHCGWGHDCCMFPFVAVCWYFHKILSLGSFFTAILSPNRLRQ